MCLCAYVQAASFCHYVDIALFEFASIYVICKGDMRGVAAKMVVDLVVHSCCGRVHETPVLRYRLLRISSLSHNGD